MPMTVSQECQYALRAVFELAKRSDRSSMTVAQIAEAQAIPPPFLVVILAKLRREGIVESKRGRKGGYRLPAAPAALTVGRVIRFINGPFESVKCIAGRGGQRCPFRGDCAFRGLWDRAQGALAGIYDATTFQDLIDGKPPMPKVEKARKRARKSKAASR